MGRVDIPHGPAQPGHTRVKLELDRDEARVMLGLLKAAVSKMLDTAPLPGSPAVHGIGAYCGCWQIVMGPPR